MNQDIDKLKTLLNKGASANEKYIHLNNSTPLHEAISIGNVEILKILLDAGADLSVVIDKNETVLNQAMDPCYANIDVIETLVTAGADLNSKNELGDTLLHLGAEENGIQLVKHLLLQGADVNSRESENRTPLHLAVERNTTSSHREK